MTHLTIGNLFSRPYEGRWGLHGDPYLWEMLAHRFENTPMPNSPTTLTNMLGQAFEQVTGYPLRKQEPVYLTFLHTGIGVQAGLVSPQWWAMTGLPVLVDRAWAMGVFREHLNPEHNSQRQMVEVWRFSIRRDPVTTERG